ncbi:MAG: hypothetical protein WCD19_07680 [Nitrososphaeraceae archaeon]
MCSNVFFTPAPLSKLRNLEFRTACKDCQKDAIVFAIVGTGAEAFYPLDGQVAYTATQLQRFGFLNIDFSDGNPHTKLTGTFYDNKGDEVRDQFTIEKEIQVKKLVDKS